MKSRWFQKLGGGGLEQFGLRLWSRLQFTALHGRKDKETVDLLWKIHQDRRSLLSAFEAYLVFAWRVPRPNGREITPKSACIKGPRPS